MNRNMNRLKLLTFLVGLLLAATACREEFNEHYEAASLAGLNVVQVLGEYEDLSLFAQLVEKAGLSVTLGESGIYTVVAPRNEQVQQWLDETGYTVDNVPDNVLVPWLNYHFVPGRYYVYDLEQQYEALLDVDFDLYPHNNLMYYSGSYLLRQSRGDQHYDSKPIRFFTSSYLDLYHDDYVEMRGVEPGDFMVEGASVSPTDRDIAASNGVVHILDSYLPVAPRCDEAIFAQSDCSIVQGWMEMFRRTEVKGADSDAPNSEIDTTSVTVFSFNAQGTGYDCNIADESFNPTVLIPTDAAVQDYLGQYMTADQFGTDYDSIPRKLLVQMLQSLVIDGYSTLGPTLLSPNYTPLSYNGTVLSLRNNLPSMISESVLSSNATVYKLNEFPELPIFTCAEAGLYIKQNHYSIVNELIEATNFNVGLSSSTYQGYDCTLLLPPDESWDKTLAEYDQNYLDSLAQDVLTMGAILANVEDGNFEHRYYLTRSGSALLYEDGEFTDPWGNTFSLTSSMPTYTSETGAIYDVDGMGKMLYSTDTTMTLVKRMQQVPELSNFLEVCRIGGWYDLMNNVILDYTIFAPTNDALDKYLTDNDLSLSGLTSTQASILFCRHVISSRRIFTDGQTAGNYSALGGTQLTLSGAWDDFQISTQYSDAGVVPDKDNIQCSNGVLHCINGVIGN